ncbi:MAG: hypothetical protein ABI254_12670 [Chthoniobacterales bacterium]
MTFVISAVKESSDTKHKRLHRIAFFAALAGIILTGATVFAQIGFFQVHSLGWYLSIGCAVPASVLWVFALGCESKARGYSFWWGLILLIPFSILAYPFLFPDRYRQDE